MINIGRVLRQPGTEQERVSFFTERAFAMAILEATNSAGENQRQDENNTPRAELD